MKNIIPGCKSVLWNPIVWIFCWGVLVFVYFLSFQHGIFVKIWDYAVFIIQLVCDLSIGIMGFLAYWLRKNKFDKKFYLLLFISIIPGLFANEIYNILINIIDIHRSSYISFYWAVEYSLFLLFQLVAWSYLLKNKIVHQRVAKMKWLTIFPYIQAALVLSLSLVFIVAIRYVTQEYIGNYKVINSVLEVIVFTVIVLCLSRTKNRSLIYLEAGFLLLIGFNFAHRFSDMLSIYYKAFNVIWLICLIVIAYGLISAVSESKDKIKFYTENSIHVLTGGAFIFFSNFILIVFILSYYGMLMLQVDKMPNLSMLVLDIPSALVFSYSLTVLLAKYLALCLSGPLDWIVRRIEYITENNGLMQKNNESQFQVHEIQKMEVFIIKTITELQQANHVKSEFLMNISHDFRTPASGIQYMSRLIHDRIIDPDLKRLQKMVVNSSEKLMILLEDVLDYSSLENDKIKLNIQYFDIAALVNELVEAMSAKAHEKNLSVTAQLQQESINFYGDQMVIKRILLNLLSNAIKFTNSGYVGISVAIEHLNNRKWLSIKINDTGVGIDKENYTRIFEPFYRVETADCSKYPGIGLGLSNVKLMLKKIGGEISLKSELGRGSEFMIYLPE